MLGEHDQNLSGTCEGMMLSDAELIIQFKKHKKSSQRGLSKQYENFQVCQSFYAGDIMDYRDNIQFSNQLGMKKRAMVQFNKVKPYVNVVKGFMAQNRRKAKYEASMPESKKQVLYSMYANSMHDYCRSKNHADQIETQQDGDMLIGGIGAVETAMTYGEGFASTDPNGQIIKGKLDMMQVFWDSYARETNLLDARWAGYEKDYALDDALELFDDSEEDDFDSSTDAELDEDGGYTWYARGGRYNKIKAANYDWTDERAGMVKVCFYQYTANEDFYRAHNPMYDFKNPEAVNLAALQLQQIANEDDTSEEADAFSFKPTAEILTFGSDIKAKLEETFGKHIEIFKFKRKCYYTAVISGSHVFCHYRSLSQSGFSIKFKTGDYDAKNKIWVGMVNSMKEPVLYYNKALTELMFTVGANSKGGVMVEEGAVEDLAEFEQKYAKTDAVIEVTAGALSGGRIRPKREGYAPSGNEVLVQLSDAAISDSNGIDKTFLGSSENKAETGILHRQRIRQVCAALACYFDSITLYQTEDARLMLDYMRIWAENNVDGTFRILGQDGRNIFLKISADKLAADYDVQIMEAPQTPEEKQEYAQILTGIADKLLQMDPQNAKAIYAMAIKNMPLEAEDIQKIQTMLVPPQGAINPAQFAAMQKQLQNVMSTMSQLQMKAEMAKIAVDTAKATDLSAQSQERLAKAASDKADALRTTLENAIIVSGGQDPTPQVSINI
ncbi:unnamed protein product [Sphagnum balticum]